MVGTIAIQARRYFPTEIGLLILVSFFTSLLSFSLLAKLLNASGLILVQL